VLFELKCIWLALVVAEVAAVPVPVLGPLVQPPPLVHLLPQVALMLVVPPQPSLAAHLAPGVVGDKVAFYHLLVSSVDLAALVLLRSLVVAALAVTMLPVLPP
jgi:hypothetical protein